MLYKKILLLILVALSLRFVLYKRPYDFTPAYNSKKEAKLACDKWKRAGGYWDYQVDQISIEKSNKAKSNSIPIQIIKKKSEIGHESVGSGDGGDLTFKLPLLNYGRNRPEIDNDVNVIKSGYKWIRYERRICSENLIDEDLILGEEYQVSQDQKVDTFKMPPMKAVKRYLF